MTTETLPHTPNTGVRVLLGAALAALVGGLLVFVDELHEALDRGAEIGPDRVQPRAIKDLVEVAAE